MEKAFFKGRRGGGGGVFNPVVFCLSVEYKTFFVAFEKRNPNFVLVSLCLSRMQKKLNFFGLGTSNWPPIPFSRVSFQAQTFGRVSIISIIYLE